MWILLLVVQMDAFATVVETMEECQQLYVLNAQYWAATGQQVVATCMRTVEI